jgi:hypothetical protein
MYIKRGNLMAAVKRNLLYGCLTGK